MAAFILDHKRSHPGLFDRRCARHFPVSARLGAGRGLSAADEYDTAFLTSGQSLDTTVQVLVLGISNLTTPTSSIRSAYRKQFEYLLRTVLLGTIVVMPITRTGDSSAAWLLVHSCALQHL
jgi:hypothetical protein